MFCGAAISKPHGQLLGRGGGGAGGRGGDQQEPEEQEQQEDEEFEQGVKDGMIGQKRLRDQTALSCRVFGAA